jgi:hypothetical protein
MHLATQFKAAPTFSAEYPNVMPKPRQIFLEVGLSRISARQAEGRD